MKKIIFLLLIIAYGFGAIAQTQVGADRIKKGSGVFADGNNAIAVVGVGSNVVVTVKMATTAALTGTWVYNNGTSGVGASLTRAASGALAAIDGVTPLASDLILVKNQVNQVHNGVYTISVLGDGSTATVLTRTTNADQTTELDNQAVKPTQGTVNGVLLFRQTTVQPVVGTNNVVYAEINGLFHTQFIIDDEGTGLGTTGTVNEIDFTGAGVTATRTGNKATVSISGGGGGGIASINSQTQSSQTLTVGTAGSDFGVTSSSGTHTFDLPDAGAFSRGVVNATNQTFAGEKTTTVWNATTQYNVDGSFFATQDAADGNVLVGSNAGVAITTATNNTLIGINTGQNIDAGAFNTVVGSVSGGGIVSGNGNTILGAGTASALSSGSDNVIIGAEAGSTITTEEDNVFIGSGAGLSIEGERNTFIGSSAGANATTGDRNNYIGNNSGGIGGSDNVFVGNATGADITTGSNNTFIGTASGAGVEDGNNNVYLGINATGGASVSKSVAIGQGATATMDNQIVFGANTVGNNIENWQINGVDYVMPSTNDVGSLTNDGFGTLSWSAPYKIYRAVLTQTGTAAPTETILENTLGSITITRSGAGAYEFTSTNLFTTKKTLFFCSPLSQNVTAGFSVYDIPDDSTIEFGTLNGLTSTPTDDMLLNTAIEIIVYP